jgi:hypothetical protein
LPASPQSQFCNGKNNKVVLVLVNIQQNTCQYEYINGAEAKSLFGEKDWIYSYIIWLARVAFFL